MGNLGDTLRKQKKETQQQLDRYKNIDFQVDTLSAYTGAGAYFTAHRGNITRNHFENETNQWQESLQFMAHEEKHRSNYNKGMYAYATSVEQTYKLNMHDEISANIVELLELREEYLRTGDINVFTKNDLPVYDENGNRIPGKNMQRFKFYQDALRKKEINPSNTNQADFDKEMSLIMNGTQQMWLEKLSEPYAPQNNSYALANYQRAGTRMKPNEENYQRGLDIAYTIGGVNFKKYMQHDVECHDTQVKQIDQNIAKGLEDPIFGRKPSFPSYQQNMSLEEYYKLAQHKLKADQLKRVFGLLQPNELTTLSKSDLADRVAHIKNELGQSKIPFADIANHLAQVTDRYTNSIVLPAENNAVFQQETDKLYTINGVNYRELLQIDANKDIPYPLTKEQSSEIISHFKQYRGLIDPVREGSPEYSTWSPNKRVSEIQHITVLDMDKDIIRKPAVSQNTPPDMSKTTDKNLSQIQKHPIAIGQVSSSYSAAELEILCKNPARWKQGKDNDSPSYQRAAAVIGLPADLIAYLYETNRRNFPQKADAAELVKDGSKLKDPQIADEIATMLGKFDIEKGKFFTVRSEPRNIREGNLSYTQASPKANFRFAELRGIGSKTENLAAQKRSKNQLNNLSVTNLKSWRPKVATY